MAKEGLGHEITELRLGLPGGSEKKRVFSEIEVEKVVSYMEDSGDNIAQSNKNQVVGWPPVCTHRRKNSSNNNSNNGSNIEARRVIYVKVSMDGAPFLRKIDLNNHKAYSDLIVALEKLFGCFGIGDESSEYVPTYEDKDEDWMLVGDVPWEMFIESCKKLRIKKRSDARGMVQTKDFLKGIIKEGSV